MVAVSRRRLRSRLAAATAGVLIAGFLQLVPTPAWALPPRSAPAVPQAPSVQHVTKAPAHFAPPKDTSIPFRPTATAWPADAAADVALVVPAGGARQAQPVRAGTLPVTVQPVAGADGAYGGPRQVRVRMHGHDAATAAGVNGVLLSVTPQENGRGDVQVSLDYSGFAQAYGGNYGSRLRLVQLPACALTDPQQAECRTATPLTSSNDAAARRVTATLPVRTSRPAGMASASATSTVQPMVLAATASTDPGQEGGQAGNYAATALKPSGSWTAGSNTGGFSYSYPVTVPPASSGLVPSLALSYSSSTVDGQTSATGAQSSWVGDGWFTPDSYVEQTFTSCADKPEGSAPPVVTSDMCYAGPILTLSLNGSSSALVWDAAKSVWKAQTDKGAVITEVTGSNNGTGTYNTDYWKVTTRDGTQYFFGRNQLPGWASGKPATNSVDTEPVYSAHAKDATHSDPCYNATYSLSVCRMAYKWHLDYVVDVHGNAMSYYYKQDSNYYGEYNGAKNTQYTRDSYLDHIDYGFTDGNAYGTAPNQIVFKTGDRCLSGTCQPLNATNAANWPDVPFDLICASGASCPARSPSFFSTVRLSSIVAQQYSTTAAQYQPVDSYALSQTLPAPHDLTSPALWLSSITRTGSDLTAGAGSAVTLPSVTFTPTPSLPNRVSTANFPELDRFRISSITTESGAVITASYDLVNPCTTPVTIDPATNTSSCYPVYWTPQGYSAPYLDWFNKYVVTKVTVTDPTGGAPATTTSYQYSGGAGWHYDDNEVVQDKYRTYGQFRGYADVKTFLGDGVNDPRTESESTFYRGLSNNNNTTAVTLTDSQGGQHDDADQLAGNVLESTTYLGENGPVDHSTITSYWISPATASRSRAGLPALTANWVAPVETFTRQATTSTGSTVWRNTEVDTTYDATTTDATIGLPTASYSHTVPADPAFDRCTTTTYAQPNTGKNLVGLTARVETDSLACNHFTEGSPASAPAVVNTLTAPTSVTRPDNVVSDTLTFYDDQTAFATTFPQPSAPSKGDVTMVRQAVDATSYKTKTRTAYDSYGRPTSVWDANGNKTATAYTMNTVGLTVATQVTNALNQSVSTTIAPARGLPLVTTDANAVVTTESYDPFGRLAAVWLNSRSTSSSANLTYTYTLSNAGVSSVTTYRLLNSGGFFKSVTIYDAQLRTRQTQNEAMAGNGRVVSDVIYDSRGWARTTYNSWWDPANNPDATAIASAVALNAQVTNQDQYTYDGLGRTVVDTKLDKGVVVSATTTVYNGDKTTVIPPAGGVARTTVADKAGRTSELDQYTTWPTVTTPANPFTGIWTVTGGTTTVTQYGYDSRGNQNSVTDAAGNTWTGTYDLLGRRTASTDPDAGSSQMVYDDNGNLTQVTDGRSKTISFTYDALNRKTGQYDAATAAQSASNQMAAWVYDNANNVTGVTHAVGQLTTETSYVGGAAYTTQQKDFNIFGESLGATITIPAAEGLLAGSYVYSHIYTPTLGLPQKDILPSGNGLPAETVLHFYTTNDLPNTLGGLTGYESSTSYDAWGRPTQANLGAAPNLAFLTNAYDEHTGRLVDQKLSRQTGTPADIDDEAYTYDPAGNLVRQLSTRLGASTPTETQCFTYDKLDRLTNAWTATDNCAATPTPTSRATVGDSLGSLSTYWTAWTINDIGNRTQQVQYGAVAAGDITTTYTYNGNNTGQPHTLTATATTGASSGSTSYTYDTAGNAITRNAAQGNQTLTWDDAGRLTKITGGTAGTSQYVYDADGNLLLQKDPGSTVLYLPSQQLTLNTSTGTVTGTRYYALPAGGTAVRTGTATTAVTFQLADLHDTPTVYLDYTAQSPSWRQSTPYGDPRGTAVASPDNHGFLNKPADTSTGLTALGARHYDPTIGRFISVDPVLNPADPQQLGGYAYAGNNPITLSDPSGLCPKDRCDGYGQNPGHPDTSPPTPGSGADQPAADPYNVWLSQDAPNKTWKGDRKSLQSWLAVRGCETSGDRFTNGDAMMCAAKNANNWMDICVTIYGGDYQGNCIHDPFHKGGLEVLIPILGTLICGPFIEACAAAVYDYAAYGGTGAAFLEFGGAAAADAVMERSVLSTEAKADEAATEDAERILTCEGNSFTPDTPVQMADGSTKPIGDVKVGDQVLTYDPDTGVTATHTVTALHSNTDTAMTDLSLAADGQPAQTVHTTQGHPFWSETRHAWIHAGDLQPGEHLHTADGTTEVVISRANRTGHAVMYNLTVDVAHTYYVTVGGNGVLVHNAGCSDPIYIKAGQQAAGPAYRMTPAEMTFVDDLYTMKPNYKVFRTNGQASQGDFLVIDYSDPDNLVGWVVELKSKSGGFPGEQFSNAAELQSKYGLKKLEYTAGTPAEVLNNLNRGRGAWNR